MIQQQLNFSREAEREADRVGFQTLTDAGFDSRGMEGFFGRLQSGTPHLRKRGAVRICAPTR